jgi:hypothetical protein
MATDHFRMVATQPHQSRQAASNSGIDRTTVGNNLAPILAKTADSKNMNMTPAAARSMKLDPLTVADVWFGLPRLHFSH